MASTSSSAASVGSDVPAGGTTCASFTSVPVAVVASVPVAVKVTVPPVDTVTSALMLPVPLAVPHWARPVATQVQVTPCQEQRERVGDGRGGGGARPGVGDDDLVGHRRAGDDPVDAVAVRDVQIGHGRGERRRGRRRVVARREVLRRRRRRRGAHDRVGRRVAARNVEGHVHHTLASQRESACSESRARFDRAQAARQRRAVAGHRDEGQPGRRRVDEHHVVRRGRALVRQRDDVGDIGPGCRRDRPHVRQLDLGRGRDRCRDRGRETPAVTPPIRQARSARC